MGEPNHYVKVSEKISSRVTSWKQSTQRYQNIEQRLNKPPVFLHQAELRLARAKYAFEWRGVPLMKDCKEMMIYQSMLNDVKPRTIIEMGTYLGGSAVWFADMAASLSLQCSVITVEKHAELVRASVRTHPGVRCITGDVNDIEGVLDRDVLAGLEHPWLVVEDCHVNVRNVMEYLSTFMRRGDYFAIEDTNDIAPYWDAVEEQDTQLNNAAVMGTGEVKTSSHHQEEEGSKLVDEVPSKNVNKHASVIEFLQAHKGDFMVDSYYTDLFGFNGTCSWDGYIRKM